MVIQKKQLHHFTIQLFDRLNLSAINESENSIDEWIMDCKSDYNKYLIIRMAHYIFKINDEIVEVDANEILEKAFQKKSMMFKRNFQNILVSINKS